MNKHASRAIGVAATVFLTGQFLASAELVSFTPSREIKQGDPVMMILENTEKNKKLKTITVGGVSVPVFLYHDRPTAFYGVDLNAKVGEKMIKIKYPLGKTATSSLIVIPRIKESRPLGVPEKMGGNTAKAEKKVVTDLEKDNRVLQLTKSVSFPFFIDSFIVPLKDVAVTDEYGYTRLTGAYTIAHKGTDFRAPLGTPVYAMNRGIVRLASRLNTYGNTIVIDHGGGVVTYYMHLSKMEVKVGQNLLRGDYIGRSGDTGYAEKPHLHLSVKIHGISIDPMSFLALFK